MVQTECSHLTFTFDRLNPKSIEIIGLWPTYLCSIIILYHKEMDPACGDVHSLKSKFDFILLTPIFYIVQDKSSDIEQQPPFNDRKYSNTLPQKRRKQNQREHHIILKFR